MQKSRKPILIIEDDDDIRNTISEFLKEEGHEVFTATNGREGLERLEQIAPPCVILLDLFMPVMSGTEFLSKLRTERTDILAGIPVVVLSAAPPEGAAATQAKTMSRSFIKKPIDLENFLKVIDAYCCAKAEDAA